MVWKLTDAKNKFSQVVDRALQEGPQKVTRRNKAVIVVALEDFERMSGKRTGFKEYLRRAPSLNGVSLKRDHSRVRGVAL